MERSGDVDVTNAAGSAVPLGRPRDPSIDDAVLGATRVLLLEVGYSRLSFGLVAKKAGVTRPTIYLRWPSKPELVYAALYQGFNVEQFIGDGKDFTADLRAKIRASSDSFAQPEVRAALPGLLADLHEAPAVRARITESLERPVRDHFARAMRAAVERGDLAPSLDSDALFDLWAGALLYRVVLRRQSDQGFADQISDLLAAAVSPDKGRRRNQPRSEIRPRRLEKKQRPDGHR